MNYEHYLKIKPIDKKKNSFIHSKICNLKKIIERQCHCIPIYTCKSICTIYKIIMIA